MKIATSPERGAPSRPPWSTSHVPAGVLTTELGSVAVPTWPAEAIVALVALAMAWIEEERTPASTVAPESSASNGSADDDARSSPPWASSSMTPGASGSCDARFAALGDQPTADGAREQRGGATEQFDVALLELGLPGAADEDQCSPGGAVGDERAAELWAEARRGSAGHESVGFDPGDQRSRR